MNYQEHFPGLPIEHKMLLLLYNNYKARLVSFTAELPFVQLSLIKHLLELWKADCLTIPVVLCISGTVSNNNRSQYPDWYWTFWKMKTPILCCLPCSTGSCTAAQRITSTHWSDQKLPLPKKIILQILHQVILFYTLNYVTKNMILMIRIKCVHNIQNTGVVSNCFINTL